MVFCQKCGLEQSLEATFCFSCGKELSNNEKEEKEKKKRTLDFRSYFDKKCKSRTMGKLKKVELQHVTVYASIMKKNGKQDEVLAYQ